MLATSVFASCNIRIQIKVHYLTVLFVAKTVTVYGIWMKYKCGALMTWCLQLKMEIFREKPILVPLFPPQRPVD